MMGSGGMQRTIDAEFLDSLPADHPDARHSRRDLRIVNRIMGNHRWLGRTLPRILRPGERALELGAGNGEFARRLALSGFAMDGLDTAPRPKGWPDELAWHAADLRGFDGYDRYSAVVGNLIFHHFDDGTLAELGERLARSARVIIACEPARRRLSQVLFCMLAPIFRANRITRHDAAASIAAGFRADELPRALGLRREAWTFRCRTTLLGAYHMVAVRRE
jgi:hypothetical protein